MAEMADSQGSGVSSQVEGGGVPGSAEHKGWQLGTLSGHGFPFCQVRSCGIAGSWHPLS